MFTFYSLQEVNTGSMSDKKERARIANISVIAGGDFRPGAFCFTKIAFSHAHFPVNFHRN